MTFRTASVAWILSLTLSAQTVAVVQEGPGQVILFPAADSSKRTTIKVGDKPHEIELSPNGRTAYVSNFGLLEGNHKVGTPGTTISVIDVRRLIERTRFTLPEGSTAPHGLKLRPPKFRELFTNAEEGSGGMVVFEANSGAVLRTFPLPPGVHNFLFNDDGSALFAFTMRGEVSRLDPESGKVVARVETGSPRGLAWTSDHRRLIAAGKGELVILDPMGLSIVKRMGNLGVGQIFYTAATAGGRWLLAPAVLDGAILVIDANTGEVTHRLASSSPLTVVLDLDGRRAWVSNVLIPSGVFGPEVKPTDGGLTLLDLTTFKTTRIAGIPDTNGLAITPRP